MLPSFCFSTLLLQLFTCILNYEINKICANYEKVLALTAITKYSLGGLNNRKLLFSYSSGS